jgi:hypothetical protein
MTALEPDILAWLMVMAIRHIVLAALQSLCPLVMDPHGNAKICIIIIIIMCTHIHHHIIHSSSLIASRGIKFVNGNHLTQLCFLVEQFCT